MKFNLRLMNTSIHTQCFLEVMDGISWALQKLGHEVKHEPLILQNRWNIVFGARAGDDFGDAKNVILYNGEQATVASLWPKLTDLYRKHHVWDYSVENATRYQSYMLPEPSVVRPGYAPVLDRIPEMQKSYDVVFFGSKCERRERILNPLRALGVAVLEIPFGTYGAERDALMARAKYCLNVHYYADAIFESVRCSYAMQNDIPVISEECRGNEAQDWGAIFCPYDQLVDRVLWLKDLSDVDYAYRQAVQRGAVQQISLIDDVRKAVAELPELVMVEQDVTASLLQVDKRHKITLSMIVKNEADVIARCLKSVAPYLTGYCVVDTGSTDGTQDIIRRTMEAAGIPGAVHDRPWKEFDGSRTEALDLARAQCDGEGWLMLIDSDEQALIDGDLEIDENFHGHYAWVTRCIGGCPMWPRPFLIRASRPWYYEMPRHEGLFCREYSALHDEPLRNVTLLSTTEGARAKESALVRFTRDAQILERWLLQHPGNTRCTYYIAQSYRDAGATEITDRSSLQKAVMYYQRRAEMRGGFDQETFSAMYQAAMWMDKLGYPWERVQHQLLRAFAYRPSRAEPLWLLANHYRNSGEYALGELFGHAASAIQPTADAFFDVDRAVYTWKAKDEWAVCLTYLNGHAKALELMLEYISIAPEFERARIQENIDMCKRTLGISSV